MALTSEETARLAAYRTAYDKLISSRAVQEVRNANGELTRFHPGNANLLKQEIETLETKADAPSGRRRGAIRFTLS